MPVPKKLEENLEKGARKHHLRKGSRRYNAYVNGTIARIEHEKNRRSARKLVSRKKGK